MTPAVTGVAVMKLVKLYAGRAGLSSTHGKGELRREDLRWAGGLELCLGAATGPPGTGTRARQRMARQPGPRRGEYGGTDGVEFFVFNLSNSIVGVLFCSFRFSYTSIILLLAKIL